MKFGIPEEERLTAINRRLQEAQDALVGTEMDITIRHLVYDDIPWLLTLTAKAKEEIKILSNPFDPRHSDK